MMMCSPSVSTHVSVIWGEPSGINVVMKAEAGLVQESDEALGQVHA